MTDPEYNKKQLRDVMEWLTDEAEIGSGSDLIETRLIQRLPDIVGLQFSGYIVILTDDGHWFIEANDGG